MSQPTDYLETTSFRDPAGRMVSHGGIVYRVVTEAGRADYEGLMKSGLYDALRQKKLLVEHEEIEPGSLGAMAEGAAYVLKPRQLPFISYPYEWAFSAWKAAAIATLEAQRLALEHGMVLKDASAYNVQLIDGRAQLIDTLSFEAFAGQSAWQAYGQFCRHFLAPLALMAHVDVRLGLLMRDFIDGVPLDLAAGMLPLRAKARPGLGLHLVVHSSSQRRYADKPVTRPAASSSAQPTALLALADSLRRTVQGLKLSRRLQTEWGSYYDFTNYSDSAAGHKAKLVKQLVTQSGAAQVWDLGGNDGRFSRVALEAGVQQAYCFDVDPLAVEKNFRQIQERQETTLTPLLLDLTNPSPAIGWANGERQSVNQRVQPGTLVMALALIHHLAISNNLPFGHIARWLSTLGDYLLIEFVPKSDSKVKKLLATRRDIFDQYSQAQFEQAFSEWFDTIDQQPVAESDRVMYLFKAKGNRG